MITTAGLRARAARAVRQPAFYRGVLGLVAMAVALAAWAFSSPVGSSPDEDFHLTSIWCSHGSRDGACEPAAQPTERQVLESLVKAPSCFAFHGDVSAACQGDSLATDHTLMTTDRGNFNGNYPPAFYWVMGLFVGPHIGRSVLVMRLVNVVLALVLIGSVWLASPKGLRRGLVAGTVVTMVPLGAFVVASINPSSWTFVSAATLLVSIVGYITAESRRRRYVLGGLAAVALAVGAGSRADASMYAIVAIGAAGIITWRRPSRQRLLRLVYPGVLAVLALLAFLNVGQSDALTNTQPAQSSFTYFVRTLLDVPSLWTGAVGGWGLGWLDTYLPAIVWVGAWSALVGVVFAALAGISRLHLLAVMALGAALWVVSGYMQYISGYSVGGAIQPRYLLPIMVMLAVAACLRVDRPPLRWSGGQWLIVVGALSVANAVALFFNLRRYVTGVDVATLNLDRGAQWWWGLPVGPMGTWVVGSAAFLAALAALTWSLRRDAAPETVASADGDTTAADRAVPAIGAPTPVAEPAVPTRSDAQV